MSVYNEKMDQFERALSSIINQNYKNIEIILVVDNPERNDVIEKILEINDSRIRCIVNKKNIGLARSMNLAAQIANGEYLARMDADDISLPERLEKEMYVIESMGADYVCAWCEHVDEQGIKKKEQSTLLMNPYVNNLLPYTNTIYHPTVMIPKHIFNSIGGYRDYPCNQDYDLWLRLYDAGYSVTVVEEILLYFCIRENSISDKKGLEQFYTAKYIQFLSKERKKKGYDSFSIENYNEFMRKKGGFNPKKIKQWKKSREVRIKNGKWSYLILILIGSIYSSLYREFLLNHIRISIQKNRFKYFK